MGGYLVHFSIYTLAMVGVIFLAMVVFKKSMLSTSKSKKKGFLEIDDALNISARKSIYVIRAGKEKFLIASDAESTSFLAKLEEGQALPEPTAPIRQEKEYISYERDRTPVRTSNEPVMKELARKLRT